MNLTDKETGRLTYKQFKGLYKAYKDTFDLELLLTVNKITYAAAMQKAEESGGGEWIK